MTMKLMMKIRSRVKKTGNADKEDGYDETNEGETQDEEKTTTIPAANLLKRPVKRSKNLQDRKIRVEKTHRTDCQRRPRRGEIKNEKQLIDLIYNCTGTFIHIKFQFIRHHGK